jgi:hypothetical protein
MLCSPAEHGAADDTALQNARSNSVAGAATAGEVVSMPSLDSDPQLKAAVSHAERQRTGLDSQTGLRCSWLDISFHIPGTNDLSLRIRANNVRAPSILWCWACVCCLGQALQNMFSRCRRRGRVAGGGWQGNSTMRPVWTVLGAAPQGYRVRSRPSRWRLSLHQLLRAAMAGVDSWTAPCS